MKATILSLAIVLTLALRAVGPRSASELFLNFTTQLYSCLYNSNEGSIATGILPTPNTPLSSLLVGRK